jgi:osmotically-inducible protein OsmY
METKSEPKRGSFDDETLIGRVYRALDEIQASEVMGSSIQVVLNDSVVVLHGAVGNHSTKAQMLEATRGVPGVQHVRDELLTDSELEIRIACTLCTDPSTRPDAFGIVANASNGFIELVGMVPKHTVARAAERIAINVKGVRAVSNRLRVFKGEKRNARIIGGPPERSL